MKLRLLLMVSTEFSLKNNALVIPQISFRVSEKITTMSQSVLRLLKESKSKILV